jgi:zinc protease
MRRLLLSTLVTSLVTSLVALGACGPKAAPATPILALPGDGDAHVAKPSQPVTPPAPADPWTGRADLIAPPAAPPAARVELPKIDKFTLANGLTVFVIKSDRLPVVSLQLAIKAGRVAEPRARLGVAELTADMLVKGTAKHDAQAIAKAIDFVGGTIRADATFEATLLSCSVLARDLPTCLTLMPELTTEPTFPSKELDKVRQLRMATLRARLDDAGALANEHVQNLLWGNDHVRGWIPSEATVAAIGREDLIAWHKAWFVPANAMLVVAGDVDVAKLKGDLDKAFGGWKKGPVPPTPRFGEPGLSGIRIRLVDKPGQTQTQIRIGQFGLRHDDARFFDSLVWNYVLGGGGFASRLMKVVRVAGGKTYGASSSFDRNLDRGSLVAATFTRNSEAVATTKLVLGEIAKMAKAGPTAEEVAAATANLAGAYGLRFQAASDVAAALIGAELHNFGQEYLANYPLLVAKVDVASAKQAAAEILDPKDYVLVLVGDAKDLEPQLKKEGWRYEKVAFSAPITPEVAAPPAAVDPKAEQAARKLLDDAIAAKGGAAKLGALKALRVSAKGTTSIQGQSVPVEITRTLVLPDKLRIDALLMSQVKIEIGVDGLVGWQRAPDRADPTKSVVHDIPAAELASVEFEKWREPELILLHGKDPKVKVTPMSDDVIDGKPQLVVKLGSPFAGVDVTLFVDKKTKLLTRMSYTDGGVSFSDDFADYKDVGGLKIAHKRTSTGGGRDTQLEVQKVEVDPKIEAGAFAKPAAP